jgi:sigma-B regulation protein RsbU (phosphoserine phosphatase)
MMPNSKFKIKQIQLDPGDILLGYTDGVTEGKNPDGHLFTKDRLSTLIEQSTTSASELIERIKEHLFEYIADAPQFDDITMLSIRRAD